MLKSEHSLLYTVYLTNKKTLKEVIKKLEKKIVFFKFSLAFFNILMWAK